MKVVKKVGRPKLNIDKDLLEEELKKYINNEQSAVKTYNTLKIGKTSFYRLLQKMEVKKK